MIKNKKPLLTLVAILASIQLLPAQATKAGVEDLEKNFSNPPESAKPSCYWWWLNANVDKEAITRDMNEFSAKGIGSVLLVCSGNWCGPNEVRGPAFLSDEWRELFKFALKEAHRVGIKVDVNLAPGWNMGGPWVTPDKGCRWFLQSETNAVGPQKLSLKLPFPGVKDGYDSRPQLGVRYSMKLLFEEVDYRDTAVVAFRTPKGGRPAARADLPAKSNRHDANCFISSELVMSQTLAPWVVSTNDQPLRVKDVTDLTARLKPDGTLDWEVPEGEWTILRTGHRMTGSQLNVPMHGQGGLENDYFDRAGVDVMFDKVGKVLIEDAGPLAGTTLRGFAEDSFEAGYPNWTANMLTHFKRYRGYDPTPYLPVFKGWIVGSPDISERFLHDYRKTVADCFADEHYGRLEERCRQYNMVTRCESAGPSWSGTVCMDGLKNLGRTTFPQGEFWQDGTFVENGQNKVTKMAASAAHIYGRRYVAAEAFTDAKEGARWGKAPSHFKPTVDRAFCEGINQVVFHTMTCQKPSEGKPGLEYGAGTHFNPNVTWWDQTAGPWISYINRCQALLQSGLFVADVLYYNGDWAPNLVGPKQVLPGLGKGYDYDFCNAEVLLTRLSVKDGRITLPDGMSYRVLVLPNSTSMPVEVLQKIKELVQAGATVLGPMPERDPGLKNYPTCDAVVKAIGTEMWGDAGLKILNQTNPICRAYGKGRIVTGKTPREVLQCGLVPPDFTYTNNAFIDFIHRTSDGAEIYFLANRNAKPEAIEATFRVSGMQPELWDPVSGQRRELPVFKSKDRPDDELFVVDAEGQRRDLPVCKSKDGCTTVPLEFEAHGSMFIVFRKQVSEVGGQKSEVRNQQNFLKVTPVQEITGPWTVQFDAQWFYPTDGLNGNQAKGLMTFDKLEDWAQRSEPAIKYFSGTAVYRKVFNFAPEVSLLRQGSGGHGGQKSEVGSPKSEVSKSDSDLRPPISDLSPLYLDLGTVKETAKVKLNGKDLGVVWCAPWRVEITGEVKRGENQLEIEVVNLWPNRLSGDSTLPEAQRRTRTNIAPDPKQRVLPSGLLGPVCILVQPDDTEFRSKFLAIGIASNTPAFSLFSVDSLGQGKLAQNPVLETTNTVSGLELDGHTYKLNGKSIWQVECSGQKLILRSDCIPGVEVPPFMLAFNQKLNHATLLGMMEPEGQLMNLPCVLHLPGMGSVRISGQGKIHYTASRDAKRKPPYVCVAFLPATPQQTRVEYKLEVTTIHPNFPGIENNPLYDGFRRDWLNIFQLQPHLRMLANNSASDICSMCVFEYADLAMHTPPLAEGLTINDLVRTTLDRYLSGVKAYGQAGGWKWKTPWTTSDSLPSLVIASCNYINSSGDQKWAATNSAKIYAWGREMFATDKNGNGLVEYPATGNLGDRPLPHRRPANWWDTINFGHEDAFSNALAYHAAMQLAALARQLKDTEDAAYFAERAAKLRAVYVQTYMNPETGLLAGWKSADGQLHDYAFTFIQGAAITYGLVDDATANRIMDKLLAKMTQVGYTNFSLGLPGNLVPIKKGDYVDHRSSGWKSPPEVFGEPFLEDGSDGFQYYENGGATGCWAYYTIHALYKLGRVEDARRILYPMLDGFSRGEFQGFDQSGMSRDWRDWKGGGHGYEGLLVDNYHVLLAVLDDLKAKK